MGTGSLSKYIKEYAIMIDPKQKKLTNNRRIWKNMGLIENDLEDK